MNAAPRPRFLFRAVWPITDETLPFPDLIDQAHTEVPALAHQAAAALCGTPVYSLARSCDVPGSGNTTAYVLLASCPARPAPARAYRRSET